MFPKRQKGMYMANNDLPEKLLEDHSDVFSDILNVLLFNGKQLILQEDLEDLFPKSQYKAESGVLHEEERDVAKRWKNNQINLASIGLENQSRYYKWMPVRTIGYDGANYREQLLGKKVKRVYPVISIVLNFSMYRWKSHLNLRDCLDIPDCLSPYVNDYKVHVFDIAYLTDEQIEMFKSDFKIVASYFVNRRKKQAFSFPDKIPEHVDAVLKLLSVLTGDPRFSEGWVIPETKHKEGCSMGEKWIDEIENRGKERGLLEGEKIGRIRAYYECGQSVESIAKKVHKTVAFVRQVLNLDPSADKS